MGAGAGAGSDAASSVVLVERLEQLGAVVEAARHRRFSAFGTLVQYSTELVRALQGAEVL